MTTLYNGYHLSYTSRIPHAQIPKQLCEIPSVSSRGIFVDPDPEPEPRKGKAKQKNKTKQNKKTRETSKRSFAEAALHALLGMYCFPIPFFFRP